jgi:hypothetical protein
MKLAIKGRYKTVIPVVVAVAAIGDKVGISSGINISIRTGDVWAL